MKISSTQIARFEDIAAATYKDRLRPHVIAYFPPVADAVGAQGLTAIIEHGLARARDHGFHGQASVRSYLDLMLLLGAAFDEDPLLPFAPGHLDWERARAELKAARDGDPDWPQGIVTDDEDPDPIDMLHGLYEEAWAWLDVVAGDDFVHLYKALARFRVALDRMPDPAPADAALADLCARIYPEKAEASSAQAMAAFAAEALTRAGADGFAAGSGRIVYGLHCFIGGIGAFRDPAFSIDGRSAADIDATGAAREAAYLGFVRRYLDRIIDAARAHAQQAG